MDLGILVLVVIIIADLIAMYYVFRIGTQHDEHHNVRSADSSASVRELYRREEERQAKVVARDAARAKQQQAEAEAKAETEPQEEQPAEETNTVSDALGDEEARRKRREAALKRKAERQAARTKASENE